MAVSKAPPKYDLLEYKKDGIPYITGTRIRVDNIYIMDYKTWKVSPENIAKNRTLPERAVRQAIAWCKENEDLVSIVLAEERRRAGLKD